MTKLRNLRAGTTSQWLWFFGYVLMGSVGQAAVQTRSALVSWDRNDSHTNLAAYIVKYGTSSGIHTGRVDVATNFTSATIGNLRAGSTYYFVVIARNVWGLDSYPSGETAYAVPTESPPPQLARLTIITNGLGTVSPALGGQDLVVGKSYKIKATPASGQELFGWTRGVTSNLPEVTFTMASNLVLEVTFTNSPYLPRQGQYNGLFHETAEVRQGSSGSFAAKLSSRGTYTAKLRIGAKSHSMKGKLDLVCRATNSIIRTGTNALVVELDFGIGNSNQVTGRITDGFWEAQLHGDRAVFHSKTNPAPYAGSYTLVLPGQPDPGAGPEGYGFGTLKVVSNGVATLAGTLADGTKVSRRVPLSKDGYLPLYVALYKGGGSVLSWLTLTNRTTDDVNGLLSWIKPPLPSSKQYSGGFTNETMTVGSRYDRPASSTNQVLNLTQTDILFDGGNLAVPFTNTITLSVGNKIVNLSSNKLSLSFSLASGLFQGSVVDPSTDRAFSFRGALLQKQNIGCGFLLGTNLSSRVVFGD
jgi:hypothetical protein